MKAHFDPLIKAMGNWHDDIFAYFDHPITNAYTESLNNLIRVVNRVGRGYSFEALRAKILFTEGFQKIKKPRYQRQRIPLIRYGIVQNRTMPPSVYLPTPTQ